MNVDAKVSPSRAFPLFYFKTKSQYCAVREIAQLWFLALHKSWSTVKPSKLLTGCSGVADPGCLHILDPGYELSHPGSSVKKIRSRIRIFIKECKYFNPKS